MRNDQILLDKKGQNFTVEASHHSNFIVFLVQIGVMLAVGLLFGLIMRWLKQPSVLGELIGGIVLGPTVLGLLFPDLYVRLFPPVATIIQEREGIIRIGMLFFMFVAGLEVNLSQLRQQTQTVLYVSVLGCAIPFGLGVASIHLFPELWGESAQNQGADFALFIGIALSISALPVITRILMDLELLHKPFGGIVITSATLNDLIGWALFALLLSHLNTSGPQRSLAYTLILTFLFAAIVLAIGHWLGQPLFRWARQRLAFPSGFLGVSAVLIVLAAAVAETLNIHAIFGAFLVGVALYPVFHLDHGASQVKEIVHQFAISLFAPLYFVSVGLKANFAAHFDLSLVLFMILLATLGKVGGAALGARLSKMTGRDSLAVGFAMNARGAMEMILASVALEVGLIDQRVFVALIIMALTTSMLSGPMLQWLLGRAQ